MYVSPSGNRLYPLTKGLYINVSDWMGEPRIHIRAFVSPQCTSSSQCPAPQTIEDVNNTADHSPQTLLPTKRGVCLTVEGFNKLMSVSQMVLNDVASQQNQQASTNNEDEEMPAGGSWWNNTQDAGDTRHPGGGKMTRKDILTHRLGASWSPREDAATPLKPRRLKIDYQQTGGMDEL